MRNALIALLLVGVLSATARDLNACLHYLFPEAGEGAWVLQDDSDGKGAYIRDWNLDAAKPTDAELDAVAAEAEVWWAQQQAALPETVATDDLVKALVAEINTLRTALNLPATTVEAVMDKATDK